MTPLQKVNIITRILKKNFPNSDSMKLVEVAVKIVEMTYEDDKISQS